MTVSPRAALLLLVSLAACRTTAPVPLGDERLLASWVQLTTSGEPAARAVVEGACPEIEIAGVARRMDVRAEPSSDFPVRVCEARVPARTPASIGGVRLPTYDEDQAFPLALLGDSGCRVKFDKRYGWHVQDCADPVKWPFARVSGRVASEKPGLVVHLGDYI